MSQTTETRPKPATTQQHENRATVSRTIINFWVDAGLLVLILLLIWTSTVIRFVFPPASSAAGWTLWAADLDQWLGFQFIVLCLLSFLVLIHVMLHWTWVCGVVASRFLRTRSGKKPAWDDGTRTLYGVGLLIVLLHILGLGTAAAVLMLQGPV